MIDRDEHLRLARIFSAAAGAACPACAPNLSFTFATTEGPGGGGGVGHVSRGYTEKEAIVGAVLAAIAGAYFQAASEIPTPEAPAGKGETP